MSIERLFPTQIYTGRSAAAARLGPRLLRESRQLRLDDASGRRWSARNYPGGYTSYGSACRMHRLSPTFAALERAIDPHVRTFARALELDLTGRALAMTDCWVNIMPRGTAHGLHLHPLATISGTFYLKAPRGCAALKIEDPRLDRMMAAPPRRRGASRANRPWVQIPAQAGALVLFESWLRHEVPANPGGERVSISFNYGWF
jgi:uncharacterized protein (TIGR02466 family)